jgi:hypothetical protein
VELTLITVSKSGKHCTTSGFADFTNLGRAITKCVAENDTTEFVVIVSAIEDGKVVTTLNTINLQTHAPTPADELISLFLEMRMPFKRI